MRTCVPLKDARGEPSFPAPAFPVVSFPPPSDRLESSHCTARVLERKHFGDDGQRVAERKEESLGPVEQPPARDRVGHRGDGARAAFSSASTTTSAGGPHTSRGHPRTIEKCNLKIPGCLTGCSSSYTFTSSITRCKMLRATMNVSSMPPAACESETRRWKTYRTSSSEK